MKTYKFCLLVAASLGAGGVAHAQSQALIPQQSSETATQQVLHEASADTGTLLSKGLVWDSIFPLSKPYAQFTPKQKADFLALYESMGPSDEPPFPLEGMKTIFNALKKAQYRIKARGELNMAVSVDPTGKATKVENYGYTTKKEMAELAGTLLLMTKFKPAVCDGKPCAMQFPFKLKLRS
jgi:hypothetical protein